MPKLKFWNIAKKFCRATHLLKNYNNNNNNNNNNEMIIMITMRWRWRCNNNNNHYGVWWSRFEANTLPWCLIEIWHPDFPIIPQHGDVIKWKHFPRYWPFVLWIHRSPVNFPHKGQWRGALMFSLTCVWINGCVNNREAGNLRRYRAHDDATVMNALCVTYLGAWKCVESALQTAQ